MRRRIVILVALAAAINVVVAWSCALIFDISRGRISELYRGVGTDHHWEVYRWDTMAGTRILSRFWSGFAPGPYNHGDPATQLAGWGRIAAPTTPFPRARSEIDEGWGLPMRTMACRFTVQSSAHGGSESRRSGVLALRESDRVGQRGYFLPLSPLWPGLFVNTIVYALVIVAVHGGVRDLRLYCAACRTRSSPTKAMTST